MTALIIIFLATVVGIFFIYQIFIFEKRNPAELIDNPKEYFENRSGILYEDPSEDFRTELKIRQDLNAVKDRWKEQLKEAQRGLAEKKKTLQSLRSTAEILKGVVGLPPDLRNGSKILVPAEDRPNSRLVSWMFSEEDVIERLKSKNNTEV